MCRSEDNINQWEKVKSAFSILRIDLYNADGRMRDHDDILHEVASKAILRPDKFKEFMEALPIE